MGVGVIIRADARMGAKDRVGRGTDMMMWEIGVDGVLSGVD